MLVLFRHAAVRDSKVARSAPNSTPGTCLWAPDFMSAVLRSQSPFRCDLHCLQPFLGAEGGLGRRGVLGQGLKGLSGVLGHSRGSEKVAVAYQKHGQYFHHHFAAHGWFPAVLVI